LNIVGTFPYYALLGDEELGEAMLGAISLSGINQKNAEYWAAISARQDELIASLSMERLQRRLLKEAKKGS
jgi:hypothetical protein